MAIKSRHRSDLSIFIADQNQPMLVLLSPAKKMRHSVEAAQLDATRPLLADMAEPLAKKLSKFSKPKLMQLMSISENLAKLNQERYDAMVQQSTIDEMAIHAFNGEVYYGLESTTLTPTQLAFANSHVRILSGMFGYLRPSDSIPPYRLEMGSKLGIGRKKNLYEYWKEAVAAAIEADIATMKNRAIINLASNEYFKVVDKKQVDAPVYTCHFREYRDGKLRSIQFNLKRARGLVTRFIIDHKLSAPEDVKQFDTDGYGFDPSLSDEMNWYFVR